MIAGNTGSMMVCARKNKKLEEVYGGFPRFFML